MRTTLGALFALLLFGSCAGSIVAAESLDSRLAAAETRAASLDRSPGGSGAEVLLVGTQPVTLRAADSAVEADMFWANHVRRAYELALVIGAAPLEQKLITQSFSEAYSVSVEGGLPVSGPEAGQVLAAFFKALIRQSSDAPLDLYVAVAEAPDNWAEVLEAIRRASVSTPSLIAGTQGQLSVPVAMEAGISVSSAQSATPGISVDFVSFSGGYMDMTITASPSVPKGLHPVYFYSEDSKFEPAATFNLRIDPPLQ